jgi:hypothetical protein
VLADSHGTRIVQEFAEVHVQIFRTQVEHRRKIKPLGPAADCGDDAIPSAAVLTRSKNSDG